jgi:transposase
MAKPIVADELWEVIEPLLSEEQPKPKGGRPRIDDRATLTGILVSTGRCCPRRWDVAPE